MATTIIIVSIASICAKYRIDEAQFSKATHCTSNGTNHYYIVESASEPCEYHVKYNSQYNALSCTCKASDNGSGCWHRRASLASEEHYRATQRARRLNEQAEVERTAAFQLEVKMHELEVLAADLEIWQAIA